MLVFADICFSVEAMGVIGVLGGGLVTALVTIAKLYHSQMKETNQNQITQLKVSENMLADNRWVIQNLHKQLQVLQGKTPKPLLADVVPEHSSPVTPEQQYTAMLATHRAYITLIAKELGLPPRTVDDPPPPGAPP